MFEPRQLRASLATEARLLLQSHLPHRKTSTVPARRVDAAVDERSCSRGPAFLSHVISTRTSMGVMAGLRALEVTL
jgi:hypothetical protein